MRQIPYILIATLLVVGNARAARGQACDASPLLIRDVNVWTSTGVLARRDVIVRDGRIASIDPAGLKRPGIARVIDGAGHTLLPGLVDSHLHFSIPGGLPSSAGPRTDTDRITAQQLVRSGVTSGRLHLASLDDAIRLKTRSQDACAAIPRLQVGGPGLSGAAVKDSSAFQGAPTIEEGVSKVMKFAAAGVEWVAIHDAHRFAPGVLEAVAAAARKTGVRLMASGSTPEEIAGALSINPDTLDYFDRTASPGYSNATLAQIRARTDLILVPTPGVPWRMVQYRASPQRLAEDANFVLLSPADRAFVLANATNDLDGAEARRAVDLVPTIANKLRQLRSLGLPVALGSDAGSTMQFQPNAIWFELEAWRAAGASHREALIAATETGARVLKLDDVGHVRPGARGDFVLYRGNVEDGAFDAGRVIAVAKGGVILAGVAGR